VLDFPFPYQVRWRIRNQRRYYHICNEGSRAFSQLASHLVTINIAHHVSVFVYLMNYELGVCRKVKYGLNKEEVISAILGNYEFIILAA
jgi:hypothetical protein